MSREKQDQQTITESPSLYDKLKNLKIPKDKREINILLLGETGVGKSTFINAFINYISFSTLSKALDEQFQGVVPSQFTITDEHYQERIIKVGKDHNESVEIGASATQACRSYVYPVEGTDLKIRLIDTPGVGDTRGIDQDNVNFENVLSFISEFKHLNAICILLKPNNSRLTVMFEFCIKQILSRLEKSASKNVIFMFTNTRSTFYRPGETLPLLKKLLSTVKGVDILCEKKNIFCTDNESFRFLAALKNKVRFSLNDVTNFSQSWTQSFEECSRMIAYIIGDDKHTGLIPHKVKNTISINEARRLIVQLSQPLAEIAQLIQDNIRALDSHKTQLTITNMTLSQLRSKLYIPFVDLKVTKLNQPTTVCTSLKCSTVYQIGGKNKWHYHQRCHDPCYLGNIPKEIIGSPELINCTSINQNGECLQCTCRYQVHMHIYYETETFENKLEDETVKATLMSKEQAGQSATKLTLKISKRISLLKKEKDVILKTIAKFACFLKKNAITPYNDTYEAYLEYLIDREKSRNEVCDFEMIKQLERMLREYTEEKTTIINAISQAEDSEFVIKADDIFNAIRSMYLLEIFGVKIKELFEAQRRSRKEENRNQTNKELVYAPKFSSKKSAAVQTVKRQNNYQQNPQTSIINRNSSEKNTQAWFGVESNITQTNQYTSPTDNRTVFPQYARSDHFYYREPNYHMPQTYNITPSKYNPFIPYSYSGPRQPPPFIHINSQPQTSPSKWHHSPSDYRWVSPHYSLRPHPQTSHIQNNPGPSNFYPVFESEKPHLRTQHCENNPRNILPQFAYNSEREVSRSIFYKTSSERHNLHTSSTSDSDTDT